jgi:hypothetical protein
MGECEGKRPLKFQNSRSIAELQLYIDLQLVLSIKPAITIHHG